jgi:hypothetical protein
MSGLDTAGEAPTSTVALATVSLRRLPYPYRAMLAICSDLDQTPDFQTYRLTMRYLNTTESTSMGRGVGLEVGNSIYFDMPDDQFAYWNTDESAREVIRAMIRSGHIDCLHSFGDLASSRAHAARALAELDRHGLRIPVWVDHSRAPTNFGRDLTRGGGDRVGYEAYHADLTVAHGVRFVWRGRVTSIIGQDVPVGFGGILNRSHLAASSKTLGKEITKRVLGHCGSRKYEMHLPNRVIQRSFLGDGQPVWEFIRCNPHWGGVSCGETADGLSHVLTHEMLTHLVRREGICVLYTHLGKVSDPRRPFDGAAREVLTDLAARRDAGALLTTTTHRLLRYLLVRDHLSYQTARGNGKLTITIDAVDDPVSGPRCPAADELQGITFVSRGTGYVDLHRRDLRPVPHQVFRQGDVTYVTIPWSPLTPPDI